LVYHGQAMPSFLWFFQAGNVNSKKGLGIVYGGCMVCRCGRHGERKVFGPVSTCVHTFVVIYIIWLVFWEETNGEPHGHMEEKVWLTNWKLDEYIWSWLASMRWSKMYGEIMTTQLPLLCLQPAHKETVCSNGWLGHSR